MATRLIGTDSANPRLPALVIAATQGTTHDDLAPGDLPAQLAGDALADANAYTDDALIAAKAYTDAELAAAMLDPDLVTFADAAETIAGTRADIAVSPAGLKYERPYFDVRSYGAVGDGTANDTAAVQAAIAAANTAGGGEVLFPRGTWLVSGLTLYSNIRLVGVGRSSIVKLANGANTDLIISDGFAGLTGGTTTGGIFGFGLVNLTLDGNRANNTSGWILRVYGSAYRVDNVWFHDGKSGGVWTQWGNGGTNMDAHWSNFKIYNCENNLLHNAGPHDSLFVNGQFFNDSSIGTPSGDLYHSAVGSAGSQFSNCHFWGISNRCVLAVEIHLFDNCQAEGGNSPIVLFTSDYSRWDGGHIFGTNGVSADVEIGVQLGSAAGTGKGCYVETLFSNFDANSYPVSFAGGGGDNTVIGTLRNSTCVTYAFGKQVSDVLIMQDPVSVGSRSGVDDLADLRRIRSAIWLSGAAGEYISCPDAAGLRVTGDLCIVACVAADDWTPASTQAIACRRASSSTYSYRLMLGGSGALQLGWSPPGTDAAAIAVTSSATTLGALANGTRRWVAATIDVDNGAGGYAVRFWTSLNGTVWAQYGTTTTGGATTSLFAGTAVLELGANGVGTLNNFAGQIQLVSIRNGIGAGGVVGGTEVARYDAVYSRGNRYRDAYANTFTHNGTAWAVMAAA